MNYNETRDILTILKINYPQSFKGWTNEQSHAFLNLWAEAFKDDPAELVVSAVKTIIYSDTREFAPNIGQVKNAMYKLTHHDEMTEQEAWGLVKRALKNSGYFHKEEFNKLPVIVQRIVGTPEQLHDWCMMDTETLDSVVASNFMRSYKARAKHEKEIMAMPESVKQLLGITTVKLKIEG